MYFSKFYEFRSKALLWTQIYAQSLEFKSLPRPTKTEMSSQAENDRKKKVLDIYDWRVKPKESDYIKPTMDDFVQEIRFTWLFLLSIPTMCFLAAVIYYYKYYV